MLTPLRNLAALFYPTLCLHCQQVVPPVSPLTLLCPTCLGQLKPVEVSFIRTHILERLDNPHVDALWIAYQFDPILQRAIHALKYEKMPGLGFQLGAYASHMLIQNLPAADNLIILPVPLHPRRLKERGYNQSVQIARGIFANMNARILTQYLVRIKHTVSQTNLSRQERLENIHKAFAMKEKSGSAVATAVLVDDVITTGATINEAARTLKQGGVQTVYGMALATPVS